jgi:hypothetical protein
VAVPITSAIEALFMQAHSKSAVFDTIVSISEARSASRALLDTR